MTTLDELPGVLRTWATLLAPHRGEVRYSQQVQDRLELAPGPVPPWSMFDSVNNTLTPDLIVIPGLPDNTMTLYDDTGDEVAAVTLD